MQFEDIEMLEVPDDSSITSDTHTDTSESSGSASASEDVPAPKTYPSFQEWLQGEKTIEFQFDAVAYKKSYKHASDFGSAQTEYITHLYKALEGLAAKKIGSFTGLGSGSHTDEDMSGDDEPVGVISKNFGKNRDVQNKQVFVNDAFRQLVESFSAFHEKVRLQIGGEDAQNYDKLASLLECVQAAWFPLSQRQKPEEVLEWINRYDPQPENDVVDAVMYHTPIPYLHPQFWTSYMGTLLSRGLFEQAEASLRACKYESLATECPALHSIIEDFVTVVGTYKGMALKGQFAAWKTTVCEFRDTFRDMKTDISELAHATIASQIHGLLCLVSGLPKSTASYVSTWYEMYGALSLFQVRDDEAVYSDYYKLAVAEKGINVASELEQSFRDVLTGKFLRVILAVDQYDPPTAAYVSKLLELKGFFTSYYADLTTTNTTSITSTDSITNTKRYVSDYLLTRHAYECLDVHDLVPVGLGILLTPLISANPESEAHTKQVVAQFLPQYHCHTNDDLEWALTICAKLGLTAVVRQLLLHQGEKSLRDGHLFEALTMLVTSYDESAASSSTPDSESARALREIHHIVWDLLFQDCLLNSSPVPDELLVNIVNNTVAPEFKIHPVIRQCVAPYAVLAEFFSTVTEEEKLTSNISRLFRLLRFKYMPGKFVPLLLAQFLPLLVAHRFDMPHLVILTELIDTFEAQWEAEPEDASELYEYSIENVPQDIPHDWRVRLAAIGQPVPPSVKDLLRELRERIIGKIGRVYIES